jgi:hypothetical protein
MEKILLFCDKHIWSEFPQRLSISLWYNIKEKQCYIKKILIGP